MRLLPSPTASTASPALARRPLRRRREQRYCRGLFLAFLLSLTVLFNYLEGDDMGTMVTPFSAMSLGNVSRLKVANAVVEIIITGVLTTTLLRTRRKQLVEAHEARAANVRGGRDSGHRPSHPPRGRSPRRARPSALCRRARPSVRCGDPT